MLFSRGQFNARIRAETERAGMAFNDFLLACLSFLLVFCTVERHSKRRIGKRSEATSIQTLKAGQMMLAGPICCGKMIMAIAALDARSSQVQTRALRTCYISRSTHVTGKNMRIHDGTLRAKDIHVDKCWVGKKKRKINKQKLQLLYIYDS